MRGHQNVAAEILDWGMDQVMPWFLLALIVFVVAAVAVLTWQSLTDGGDPSARVYFGSRHSAYLSEPVCAAISEVKAQ